MFNAFQIEKHYGARTVLDGVSLSIGARDRVGLVGRNGCGKTTLLGILAGADIPDRGSVAGMRRGLSIGYLPQMLDFVGKSTVMQIVAERVSPDVREWEIRRALRGLGFEPQQFGRSARSLSCGEKTRLTLACIVLGQHDLLLLDEPTSHLDLPMIEWLEEYLKAFSGALLVSSHDRRFLDHVVSSVLELDSGRLTSFAGGYTAYSAAKQKRLEQQREEHILQQRQIRALQEFARRQLGWAAQTQSGPKRGRDQRGRVSEKMAKRARAAERRIEQMEKVEKPRDVSHLNMRLDNRKRSGQRVFEARDLAMVYGDRSLFAGVDLDIDYGDRLAIAGRNGAGKTTLLRVLLGDLESSHGSLRRGAGIVPFWMQQEHEDLDPELTVLETIEAAGGVTLTEARTLLACFLFREDEVFKRVGNLSGGERARLAVAGSIVCGANLMVLDEPTNNLDIDTRERLENALNAYTGTLIIVSHDRWLVDRLTDRTITIVSGHIGNE